MDAMAAFSQASLTELEIKRGEKRWRERQAAGASYYFVLHPLQCEGGSELATHCRQLVRTGKAILSKPMEAE